MIKSVLLHANDDDGMNGRLQVALDVCRAHGAHLTCLYVTPFNAYGGFDPMGGLAVQSIIIESLRDTEAKLRARVMTFLAHDDVVWDWTSVDGDIEGALASASALSDLIIVSQYDASSKSEHNPLPIVDDIAVHSSCAVLVVPQGVTRFDGGGAAVIGWNASPESSHAIRASLSFLKAASSVHIASVDEHGDTFPQTDANRYLARHGITSDIHDLPGSNRTAAQVLHDFAVTKQAAFIVMGAYGRSRFRETILGGATRSLLSTSKIPLLLAH